MYMNKAIKKQNFVMCFIEIKYSFVNNYFQGRINQKNEKLAAGFLKQNIYAVSESA